MVYLVSSKTVFNEEHRNVMYIFVCLFFNEFLFVSVWGSLLVELKSKVFFFLSLSLSKIKKRRHEVNPDV